MRTNLFVLAFCAWTDSIQMGEKKRAMQLRKIQAKCESVSEKECKQEMEREQN